MTRLLVLPNAQVDFRWMRDELLNGGVDECAHQGGENEENDRPEDSRGHRFSSIDSSNSVRRRLKKPVLHDVQHAFFLFRCVVDRLGS